MATTEQASSTMNTRAAEIETLRAAGDVLHLHWADGPHGRFHAVWLRDNCRDPASRHPGNDQRLFDIDAIDPDVRLDDARLEADGRVWLRFAPDGHQTRFDADWLRRHCYSAPAARQPRRLWDRALQQALPMAHWETVSNDPQALGRWLAQVDALGFAVLEGVPCQPGQVTRVAEAFGYVRETNYGRYFDVRSVIDPVNLAYTGMALSVHTDNPYRDPVPGLQLLHCLASEAEGGDSVVVDGFMAAARLRDSDPAAFDLLSRYQVPFRYADAGADLRARGCLIETDHRGEVVAVRYNNRSAAPFDVPAEVMPSFYRAYRAFTAALFDPALAVGFRMRPGDLFIVDNRRVLHGRKGFSGSGTRHLQGCYADRDALASRLRLLGLPAAGDLLQAGEAR